jgi:hypothetical protein
MEGRMKGEGLKDKRLKTLKDEENPVEAAFE